MALAITPVAGGTATPGALPHVFTPYRPPPDHPSILGFLGNLIGNVEQMGQGIATLGVDAVHDIGVAGADLLPGRQSIEKNGFYLDNVAKAIVPSMLADYKKRYATSLDTTRHQLYENPLSYILDALSVASVVGKGADIAGQAAIKAVDPLSEAGANAASAMGRVSDILDEAKVAKGASQATTQAGVKALIDSGVDVGGSARLAAKILPKMTGKNIEGIGIEAKVESVNPLTRAVMGLARKGLTEPIEDLAARTQSLADEVGRYSKPVSEGGMGINPPGELMAEYDKNSRLLLQAKRYGMTRIETPRVANFNARVAAGKAITISTGEALLHRDAAVKSRLDAVTPGIEEDRSVRDTLPAVVQGHQYHVVGHPSEQWAIDQGIEDLEGPDLVLRNPPATNAERTIPSELERQAPGGGPSMTQRAGMPTMVQRRGNQTITRGGTTLLEGPPAGMAFPVTDQAPAGLLERAQRLDPELANRYEAAIEHIRLHTKRIQSMTDEEYKMFDEKTNVSAQIDGANRLIRNLYDDLQQHLDHMDPTMPDVHVDAVDRTVGRVRLTDVELKGPEFDHFADTPAHVWQRQYFAMRLRHGATPTGQWGDDMMEGGPSAQQLDDAIHEGGHVAPAYWAYVDPERTKPSDWFPSKALRGANVYAADPNEKLLRGTLLKEGTYLRDPLEVYGRRGARMSRAWETYNMWDTLTKRFGYKVQSQEEIPAGWVAVSPDAIFIHHRTRMQFLEGLDKLKAQGMDTEDAINKMLNDVWARNREDVDKLLGADAAKEGAPEIWAIPQVTAEALQHASKYASVFGGKNVRLFWDTPINAWRSMVLTMSPRWIFNNTLGNTMFGAMQGIKVQDTLRILGEHFRAQAAGWFERHADSEGMQAIGKMLGGGDIRENSLAGQVRKLAESQGVDIGTGYAGSRLEQYKPQLGGDAANTRTGALINRTRQSKVYGVFHNFSEGVRNLNASIESAYRESSFLTAAERQIGKNAVQRLGRTWMSSQKRISDIMEHGFNESKARGALDEVNFFFGDYGKMSPFERHVVRRFIFPFWGFYRHQIGLLSRFPFEYPLRAQVIAQLGKVNQDMVKDYGAMPGWLDGAVPLSPPGPNVSFLTATGPNPFSGSFQPWTQMLNPAIKVAVEQATGKSLYTGDPFTDENVITPFGSDQSFRVRYGPNGQVIPGSAAPVDKVAPGILEHLLSQVPQYEMLKDVLGGGATYDTATLPSVMRGHGVIRDKTGAPAYPTGALEQLLKLAGISYLPDYNVGGYQEQLGRDQAAAMKYAYQHPQLTG